MILKIENYGKIAEAEIKLDGITVICGENNTGKSTIGKALFSFFNSLHDYKNKILSEKIDKVRTFIMRYSDAPWEDIHQLDDHKSYFMNHEGKFTVDDVREYFDARTSVKASDAQISSLVNYMNLSEEDILNEYVYRYFNNVMNNQVKNMLSSENEQCIVIGEIKGKTNKIALTMDSCVFSMEVPIEHSAYYINSPFSLDWLNQTRMRMQGMNILERNVIAAIRDNQSDMDEDSMTNIIQSVLNKKDLDKVRDVLKNAYKGDTRVSKGKYYYHEGNVDFDFRNISVGLKSFALIERLLETGVLTHKDVLILDEPEIHLHSEWQIIYAELIVVLQKTFDLTILLVTHSFQFLEALDFFMKKYVITEKGNYYTPLSTDRGFVMKSCGNNPDELKQNLVKGSIRIADMEFEYNMEKYGDDTDET